MANCRSCSKPVIWTITEKSGKRMPVDPAPRPDGNVQLTQRPGEDTPYSKTLSKVEIEEARRAAGYRGRSLKLYVSHFSTCPHARQHRKR